MKITAALSWALALAAHTACTMDATAADPLPRNDRLAVREVAAYLELSVDQQQQLLAQRTAYAGALQKLAAQAQALKASPPGGTAPAAGSAASTTSEPLCQQAQALQAQHQSQMRSLLNPRQAERLSQLESAFALMPLVEAAQRAGLMADHLNLPPMGMAGGMANGMATVATAWRRAPAELLPGCTGTRIFREVELKDSGEPKRPPPR